MLGTCTDIGYNSAKPYGLANCTDARLVGVALEMGERGWKCTLGEIWEGVNDTSLIDIFWGGGGGLSVRVWVSYYRVHLLVLHCTLRVQI